MKANEAPKKIYVVDATFPDYVDFDGSPINTKRIDDHDIEYTRTDAFIEKACKFLKDKGSAYITIIDGQLILRKGFVKDFRKYMEGE